MTTDAGRRQSWRCPHAPECEERFDTLDALNEHVDGTVHDCCQRRSLPTDDAS